MLKEQVDSSLVEMRAEHQHLLLIGREFSHKTQDALLDLSKPELWVVGILPALGICTKIWDMCVWRCMSVRTHGRTKKGPKYHSDSTIWT